MFYPCKPCSSRVNFCAPSHPSVSPVLSSNMQGPLNWAFLFVPSHVLQCQCVILAAFMLAAQRSQIQVIGRTETDLTEPGAALTEWEKGKTFPRKRGVTVGGCRLRGHLENSSSETSRGRAGGDKVRISPDIKHSPARNSTTSTSQLRGEPGKK